MESEASESRSWALLGQRVAQHGHLCAIIRPGNTLLACAGCGNRDQSLHVWPPGLAIGFVCSGRAFSFASALGPEDQRCGAMPP